MADPRVQVSTNGNVAVVRLDDPDRRNALGLAVLVELTGVLRRLGADGGVQAVVLEASGPVFSSGHDLAEMRGRDEEFYQVLFSACVALMGTVHRIPQPVVAKVGGLATAAGCQLVASCDLVVASEAARFATPGVRVGLFCSTPMVPLSRAVGPKRAMEMLLTGEPIDAHTAQAWGLVNRVVPADRLDAATDDLVAQVTRSSPYVVGMGKMAFYEQLDRSEAEAYALAEQVMVRNAGAQDAQEGFAAFLDKRDPSWRGR